MVDGRGWRWGHGPSTFQNGSNRGGREESIDKALAVKKVRLVPPQP
jgi:hypothetical protein